MLTIFPPGKTVWSKPFGDIGGFKGVVTQSYRSGLHIVKRDDDMEFRRNRDEVEEYKGQDNER